MDGRAIKFPTNDVAVECQTCHRTKHHPPAVAARRRYCDAFCFANRPASPQLAILRALGGARAVADRLSIRHRTVRGWAEQGIPSKYYYDVVGLAAACGQTWITYGKLREIAAGRHSPPSPHTTETEASRANEPLGG